MPLEYGYITDTEDESFEALLPHVSDSEEGSEIFWSPDNHHIHTHRRRSVGFSDFPHLTSRVLPQDEPVDSVQLQQPEKPRPSPQQARRSLRPRTAMQINPYQYEQRLYEAQCRLRGIKPVRLPRSVLVEAARDPDDPEKSETQRPLSQNDPSSPPPVHNKHAKRLHRRPTAPEQVSQQRASLSKKRHRKTWRIIVEDDPESQSGPSQDSQNSHHSQSQPLQQSQHSQSMLTEIPEASDHDSDEETERLKELARYRRKLKGILPPSFLTLDKLKKSSKKSTTNKHTARPKPVQLHHRRDRHTNGDQPETILHGFGPHDEASSPISTAAQAHNSSDESAESGKEGQEPPVSNHILTPPISDVSDGEVYEKDSIDYMLQPRAATKRVRRTRSRPHRKVAHHSRSRKPLTGRSEPNTVSHSAKSRISHASSVHRERRKSPRLSIVGALRQVSSRPRKELPAFLKIADRTARDSGMTDLYLPNSQSLILLSDDETELHRPIDSDAPSEALQVAKALSTGTRRRLGSKTAPTGIPLYTYAYVSDPRDKPTKLKTKEKQKPKQKPKRSKGVYLTQRLIIHDEMFPADLEELAGDYAYKIHRYGPPAKPIVHNLTQTASTAARPAAVAPKHTVYAPLTSTPVSSQDIPRHYENNAPSQEPVTKRKQHAFLKQSQQTHKHASTEYNTESSYNAHIFFKGKYSDTENFGQQPLDKCPLLSLDGLLSSSSIRDFLLNKDAYGPLSVAAHDGVFEQGRYNVGYMSLSRKCDEIASQLERRLDHLAELPQHTCEASVSYSVEIASGLLRIDLENRNGLEEFIQSVDELSVLLNEFLQTYKESDHKTDLDDTVLFICFQLSVCLLWFLVVYLRYEQETVLAMIDRNLNTLLETLTTTSVDLLAKEFKQSKKLNLPLPFHASLAFESWLVIINVCDQLCELVSGCLPFWDHFNAALPMINLPTESLTAEMFDSTWKALLVVSSIASCTSDAIISRPELNNWTLVDFIMKHIIGVASKTFESATLSRYLCANLGRCLNLLNIWKWPVNKSLVVALYKFFAARGFEDVEETAKRRLPEFIFHDKSNAESLCTVMPDDTCFHVYLKLAALSILRLNPITERGTLTSIVGLITPLHGRLYKMTNEMEVVDVECLCNTYSLLLTLFWSTPPKYRPSVGQLRDVIVFPDAHAIARSFAIKAWLCVAKILSTDAKEIQKTVPWYNLMANSLISDYQQLHTPVALPAHDRNVRVLSKLILDCLKNKTTIIENLDVLFPENGIALIDDTLLRFCLNQSQQISTKVSRQCLDFIRVYAAFCDSVAAMDLDLKLNLVDYTQDSFDDEKFAHDMILGDLEKWHKGRLQDLSTQNIGLVACLSRFIETALADDGILRVFVVDAISSCAGLVAYSVKHSETVLSPYIDDRRFWHSIAFSAHKIRYESLWMEKFIAIDAVITKWDESFFDSYFYTCISYYSLEDVRGYINAWLEFKARTDSRWSTIIAQIVSPGSENKNLFAIGSKELNSLRSTLVFKITLGFAEMSKESSTFKAFLNRHISSMIMTINLTRSFVKKETNEINCAAISRYDDSVHDMVLSVARAAGGLLDSSVMDKLLDLTPSTKDQASFFYRLRNYSNKDLSQRSNREMVASYFHALLESSLSQGTSAKVFTLLPESLIKLDMLSLGECSQLTGFIFNTLFVAYFSISRDSTVSLVYLPTLCEIACRYLALTTNIPMCLVNMLYFSYKHAMLSRGTTNSLRSTELQVIGAVQRFANCMLESLHTKEISVHSAKLTSLLASDVFVYSCRVIDVKVNGRQAMLSWLYENADVHFTSISSNFESSDVPAQFTAFLEPRCSYRLLSDTADDQWGMLSQGSEGYMNDNLVKINERSALYYTVESCLQAILQLTAYRVLTIPVPRKLFLSLKKFQSALEDSRFQAQKHAADLKPLLNNLIECILVNNGAITHSSHLQALIDSDF
ncbi:hypothetical protein CANCADRAFT_32049 [Tortispora caseinolytica NRRL Y-17796]|uniref:Uncharacterized protein n=1 Tax=Tortispora caseinolytica NRRL Y-17796 TaxID=767744 RepID=A0A1E4TI57_9ASCO|nr:hypothetical protein CANCADRAFT_32049 [Tortispora caseinolytica NRRL Y-17796]